MKLPIFKVTRDECDDIQFDLTSNHPDFEDLKNGDYLLVKIESLNDRIAVEEFAEQLKNK
jgi:hypothetical protein